MKVIRNSTRDFLPASHEDPTDPGAVKKILIRREDLLPGRSQMINWATLLPGKSFRPHYHEAMDEVFVILDGTVEITIGQEKETLERGDAVVIPEGEIHTMKNLTDREVSYIAIGLTHNLGGKTVVV
ncbi:MAG: cupin domain-containing protein [bacterium]|nr:cupin domain-containing protein [bacterium]